MTVSDLIKKLQKCPPDSIVMYNVKQAIENESIAEDLDEYDCSVDDVLIGGGTIRGFVFLTEERIPE